MSQDAREPNPNRVDYVTPPTIGQFMLDDSFVRLIIGPVGSGKSAGCFMELLRRAQLQAPDARGLRQTRFAIIRNTLQQIRQTCLADIQLWLGPIAHYKVTDATLQVRFSLPDGTRVESDWMLIPLDSEEDQQRLLSLNLTGAWISEFREIDLKIIDSITGRLGRWPAKAVAEPTWAGIIAESNPPDEDSDWYKKLELETPPNWKVFRQPGGMDREAENIDNLPTGYYERLVANNSPDWVDVHVHAKYGKSLGGQAVFRSTFRPDFHVTKELLTPVDTYPVLIAQDFGRTPACLFGQVDPRGRLLVFRELYSDDAGIELFATQYLKPFIFQHFMGKRMVMVADPAGDHRGQITEESPFMALKRLGFQVFKAPTNDIDPRLRAVETLFLRQIDGGPAVLISEAGCPRLVYSLRYGYRYRRKTTGVLDEKPDKNHPDSDLADCFQYLVMSAGGSYYGKVMDKLSPPRRPPPPSARGWT